MRFSTDFFFLRFSTDCTSVQWSRRRIDQARPKYRAKKWRADAEKYIYNVRQCSILGPPAWQFVYNENVRRFSGNRPVTAIRLSRNLPSSRQRGSGKCGGINRTRVEQQTCNT